MYLELRTLNTDVAEVVRGYIERRLRFSLSRFGQRVGRVSVTLSRDNNGLFTCRIQAEIVPFGSAAVKESAPNFFAAVDRATGRLGRLFGRELNRVREARTTRESIRMAA
jgi:ribosome-associated translation inhibitor RaiA